MNDDDEFPNKMPSEPGYYAYDPELGWIKFEHKIDMLFYRVTKEPPCMLREITDPAEHLL